MHAEAIPWYSRALDFEALAREFPPPPDYFRTTFRASRDELRALQERRFLETMRRGWEIPFFQRHWRNAGMQPGDIRGLDDLQKIPPYDVHDIRASIERNPPFGDFMGISPADGKRMPLVLQTSGGTTGLPRPMLYAPRDRETMAIMGGRRFALHGVRPGDMVLVTYALGLSNGAAAPREALWRYSGAVPVMTGGGATTPTRRQIEIAQAWGINVILGFPSYLRHMALVARNEMGIDPKSLGIRLIGTHLGMEDRRGIEELWGAPCFDAYGTHESGMMAAECEQQSGMHVQEDAYILEIADPDSGRILAEGEQGTVYITTLYKYGAPQIRFNVNDISAYVPGTCACGGTLRRLARIFGRNDNMVKLRGINVFPEAIGAVVAGDRRTNGEFFCFVDRVGKAGTDEMTVLVEVTDPAADRAAVKTDLERRMKEVLGVRVTVTPAAKGALDPYTGTSQTSKIKRLLDRRQPRA
ncbi:MAG: phenylacetate--CoA ligase family protein [Betaproteobacteria bacterium]|nr:phenylacetate--CoA ligase family protein [Betaproteobacteria bacterium]